jgi:hypothetical protein
MKRTRKEEASSLEGSGVVPGETDPTGPFEAASSFLNITAKHGACHLFNRNRIPNDGRKALLAGELNISHKEIPAYCLRKEGWGSKPSPTDEELGRERVSGRRFGSSRNSRHPLPRTGTQSLPRRTRMLPYNILYSLNRAEKSGCATP